MPFITLDGLDLEVTDISEKAPELIGDETRADDGSLRGAITDEKRQWDITLNDMAEADLVDLRARLALGAHVSVSGDAIGGVLTVRGYLRDMGYIWTPPNGTHMRAVRLELVEV